MLDIDRSLLIIDTKEFVMKTSLLTLVVGLMIVGLTACNDKGGGDKDVSIPGLPQGRVNVTGYNGAVDPNNYCDIAQDQRSVTCATVTTNSQGQSQTCVAPTIIFSDITTMCQNLSSQLNNSGTNLNGMNNRGLQCGRTAMQFLYSQKCLGIPTQQNLPASLPIPNQNGNGSNLQNRSRIIRCDYEAVRNHDGIIFTGSGARKTVFLNDSESASFKANSDRFGVVTVSYERSADVIRIDASRINKDTNVVQTGYGGQEVRMEVVNDDNSVRVTVSCRDADARILNSSLMSYVCNGTSKINGRTEKVNTSISADDLLEGDVQLADGLILSVAEGSAGLNNALVTLKASGISRAASTVASSAYVNGAAQLKISDGNNRVDVSCRAKR